MTPFGAWVKPGCVGCAEWHGWHRRAMTACASVKLTAAWAEGTSRGAIAKASANTPTAALAGIHHTARRWWRRLKYWRTHAPRPIRTTRISQLLACPYVIGK